MAEEEQEQEQEQKQELIKAAKQLPPTAKFSLQPRTFDEAYRFANLIAESTLIPKEFQKNPANVLIAVQYGMELGVTPMQAIQSMYVVNGRPSIYGDLVPALILQSGLCEQFDEEYDKEKKIATCTVKRRGFKPITRTFSWEDAQRAKASVWENNQRKTISLADKETYQSYPQRMLPMRARSYAVRDIFPDVLKGLAIKEEIDDLEIETTATTERQSPIALPQPKQSGTVADFKARQAEKAKPDIGGDLSDKVDPKHRELADAMDRLRQEQVAKGKADGERRKPVVDKAVSAKAGDGAREDRTARENAPGTAARQEAQANSQSEPEKKPAAAKAGGEPEKEPKNLKAEIMAWISVATLEDLNSQDHEKCFIRKVFATKTLLAELTPDERAEVLTAYDKERRGRD